MHVTKVTAQRESVRPMIELSEDWRKIRAGDELYGTVVLTEELRELPLRTAQRFVLWAQNADLSEPSRALAQETVDFYGRDYLQSRYPNLKWLFDATLEDFGEKSPQHRLVRATQRLFAKFGYVMPASFYWCQLSPLGRDHIFEERALRFDPREQNTARAFDAVLHAQNCFAIQRLILEATTHEGLRFEHGCDCNHILATLTPVETPYVSGITPQEFIKYTDAYLWQLFANYMYFPIWPSQPRIETK